MYAGDIYYSGVASAKLFHLLKRSRFNPAKNSKAIHFTNRQLQIISLICKEYTNKEIAAELGLSPRTVEEQRMHIQDKMGVKNMVGIALYAVRDRLVDIPN